MIDRISFRNQAPRLLSLARAEIGMSQEQLAKVMGTTRNTIANLEQGRALLTIDKFVLYCLAVRKDPVQFLAKILNWCQS